MQEHGRKQAELERRGGSEPLDDLPRAQVVLMGVGPHEVEVELVKGSLGQEVGAAGEGFQVVELILDQAVDGLDPSADGLW